MGEKSGGLAASEATPSGKRWGPQAAEEFRIEKITASGLELGKCDTLYSERSNGS